MVRGLGCRVQGLGFRGIRLQDFRVSGLGVSQLEGLSLWFRCWGLGFGCLFRWSRL